VYSSKPTPVQEDSIRLTLVYTLLVSRTRTSFGDRAFSIAGPQLWNNLPMDLRLVTQPFQTVAEDVFI